VVRAEPKKSDAKAVSEKGKVQWSDVSPEDEKKAGPRKTCTGFLGSQIGAVRKVGRPYSCGRQRSSSISRAVLGFLKAAASRSSFL
jgi:hypothetical protein